MNTKKGINKLGQKAVDALLKEFTQIVDLNVFECVDPNTLTTEQKRETLVALSLVKLKHNSKIKGGVIVDGRPQRKKYNENQTSSVTYHQDSLMISLSIDALEHRCVDTGDVPGAYLHAHMKDFTLIKLENKSVNIMCQINST